MSRRWVRTTTWRAGPSQLRDQVDTMLGDGACDRAAALISYEACHFPAGGRNAQLCRNPTERGFVKGSTVEPGGVVLACGGQDILIPATVSGPRTVDRDPVEG